MPDSVQPHAFKLKNGAPAVIREARSTDAKEIVAFVDEVAGESDFLSFGRGEFELSEEEEADFLAKCQATEGHIYLVAVAGGRIVATLHFSTGKRARVKHSGEFGIVVSKAYWGEGIGAALVDRLVEWAQQANSVRKINLRVRADNEKAIRLYQAKGFKHEGTLSNEICIAGQYYNLIAMGMTL